MELSKDTMICLTKLDYESLVERAEESDYNFEKRLKKESDLYKELQDKYRTSEKDCLNNYLTKVDKLHKEKKDYVNNFSSAVKSLGFWGRLFYVFGSKKVLEKL